MTLEILEATTLDAPIERAFDLIASIDGMLLFTGFGMVPGIARVEELSDAEHLVHNSDGTRHRERVLEREAPTTYALSIGPFESPMQRLVTHAEERWELTADGSRTHARRRFRFVARGALAWLLLYVVLVPQMRRAMRRNHRAMQQRLSS